MNLIAELQHSNLDPSVVSTLLARLKQSDQDAIEFKQLSERIQRGDQQIKQFSDRIERDAAYIKAANLKIAALTLELAQRKRIQFGSKSEAFTPEQRELFQETEVSDIAAMEGELEVVARDIGSTIRTSAKFRPTGRQALPTHLPRIEHRHEPDTCTCDACGSE